MTPEAHIRANEIRRIIQEMRFEIERLRTTGASVCRLLSQDQDAELRERLIDYLEARVETLQQEYDDL